MQSKKNKKNKFFEALKEGMEEVLAHKQGKIKLHSEIIEIPEPPCEYISQKFINEEIDYKK